MIEILKILAITIFSIVLLLLLCGKYIYEIRKEAAPSLLSDITATHYPPPRFYPIEIEPELSKTVAVRIVEMNKGDIIIGADGDEGTVDVVECVEVRDPECKLKP